MKKALTLLLAVSVCFASCSNVLETKEKILFQSLKKELKIDTVIATDEACAYDWNNRRVIYLRDINIYVNDSTTKVDLNRLEKFCKEYYETVLKDQLRYSYVSMWYATLCVETGVNYFPDHNPERAKEYTPKRPHD